MKKLTTVMLLALGFVACKKDKTEGCFSKPDCIQTKMETFTQDSRSIAVLTTKLQGECVYYFATEAPWADGTDDVLDAKCELVCQVGGFRLDPCNCKGVNFCELTFDTLWHR